MTKEETQAMRDRASKDVIYAWERWMASGDPGWLEGHDERILFALEEVYPSHISGTP